VLDELSAWKELAVDVLYALQPEWLVFWCGLSPSGVVTLHEFAHGITCCHFGGKVQEIGFMLIYFQPPFIAMSAIPGCFHRSGAHVGDIRRRLFQLVVWSICTVLWRVTDTDTTINQLALVVIVFVPVCRHYSI
jgi:putative peptide zinc metalloprotease protein